jgi:hypothetical protein
VPKTNPKRFACHDEERNERRSTDCKIKIQEQTRREGCQKADFDIGKRGDGIWNVNRSGRISSFPSLFPSFEFDSFFQRTIPDVDWNLSHSLDFQDTLWVSSPHIFELNNSDQLLEQTLRNLHICRLTHIHALDKLGTAKAHEGIQHNHQCQPFIPRPWQTSLLHPLVLTHQLLVHFTIVPGQSSFASMKGTESIHPGGLMRLTVIR